VYDSVIWDLLFLPTAPADDAKMVRKLLHKGIIMAIATHLGPWLLGTVKNTTGTTAGTVRNTGATIVAQTGTIGAAGTTTIGYIPAGALITSVQLITTTLFDAGTVTIQVAGTAITSAFTLPTSNYGPAAITTATTTGAAALYNNVGTTDVAVTAVVATAASGAGTVVIGYMVRNSDGTFQPTAFTA
jgi:hypothetical protein